MSSASESQNGVAPSKFSGVAVLVNGRDHAPPLKNGVRGRAQLDGSGVDSLQFLLNKPLRHPHRGSQPRGIAMRARLDRRRGTLVRGLLVACERVGQFVRKFVRAAG